MCLIQLEYLVIAKVKAYFFRVKETIWCLINVLGTSRVKSLFEDLVYFCFVTQQWNFINLITDSAEGYTDNICKKGICRAI